MSTPKQLTYCQVCGYISDCPLPNIDWQRLPPSYELQCTHCNDTHIVSWMPSWAVYDHHGDHTPLRQNGTQRFVSDARTVFKMCATIGKATSAIRNYGRGLYFVDVGPRHLPVLSQMEGNRLACTS